jgi:hypothetical protein
LRKPRKTRGIMSSGVACLFLIFRGVWEKLWELSSVRGEQTRMDSRAQRFLASVR